MAKYVLFVLCGCVISPPPPPSYVFSLVCCAVIVGRERELLTRYPSPPPLPSCNPQAVSGLRWQLSATGSRPSLPGFTANPHTVARSKN